MTQGKISVPDYVGIGFEKIDHDLQFLIECLGEVLEELGLSELAAHLPWFGKSDSLLTAVEALPIHLGLVYSIAFQLLNMVEENAAAYIRTLREASEGLTAERGLWGESLKRLTASGVGEDEIAEMLSAMGMEMELSPLIPGGGQLEETARAVASPGAQSVCVSGKLKGGAELRGVLILVPCPGK